MATNYRFAREMRRRRAALWPAVRRELQWAEGLCMMAFHNLSGPWHPEVIAVDASWRGGGAVSARLPPGQLRDLGRYNERRRFSREDEERHAPRTSSLSLMSREPVDLAQSRPSKQVRRVPPGPREVWLGTGLGFGRIAGSAESHKRSLKVWPSCGGEAQAPGWPRLRCLARHLVARHSSDWAAAHSGRRLPLCAVAAV